MMKPIEYQVAEDSLVTIRLCPRYVSTIRGKPEYWYLRRPFIACPRRPGLDTLYWDGTAWADHDPKQFATAEEAFAEWEAVVRTLKPCQ